MEAPPDFKGRRLALANTFRRWATANEAARELGTETGSVFGLIRRMHSEKILEAKSDPDPPTRGTEYRLTHRAFVALDGLDEARAGEARPGLLSADQCVLIVKGRQLSGLEAAVADPSLSSDVAWASWLGSGWLIAMEPESDGHSVRKLATVLEARGYECDLGKLDEILPASRLRRQFDSNLQRAGVER